MIRDPRLKTITVHTRKQTIAIYEEFKARANMAYEQEDTESFYALMTIVKVAYYMHPMPFVLFELNDVGPIPFTVLLENLLAKMRLVKLDICLELRQWVVALLWQFQTQLPELSLENVRDLRECTQLHIDGEWSPQHVIGFVNEVLEYVVGVNDLSSFGIMVLFLRNFLVFMEEGLQQVGEGEGWGTIIANLVRGCQFLKDLKRQETAVCICYFLCLKNSELCHPAVYSKAIEYLMSLVRHPDITRSFANNALGFHKHLMLYLHPQEAADIDVTLIEDSLSQFAIRFDSKQVIDSLRDAIALLEKKVDRVDCGARWQQLQAQYSSKTGKELPDQLISNLYVLSLYMKSQQMPQLVAKYYPRVLDKMIREQSDPKALKVVFSLLAYHFRKGHCDQSVAMAIVAKINHLISDKQAKSVLMADRKRLLIDLVVILRDLLSNREHNEHVVKIIRDHKLDQKLWKLSDCTVILYERELIGMSCQLSKTQTACEDREQEVYVELEQSIIQRAKVNMNKGSWEIYDEFKFLSQLIVRGQQREQEFRFNKELPPTVIGYLKENNAEVGRNLLGNVEMEDGENLRKELNYVCCKIATDILSTGAQRLGYDRVKQIERRMIELSSSKHELDDLYDLVSGFMREETEEDRRRRRTSIHFEAPEEYRSALMNKVAQLFMRYFDGGEDAVLSQIKLNSDEDVMAVSEGLSHYSFQQHLDRYLKLVVQLSKKPIALPMLYFILAPRLPSLYKQLLTAGEEYRSAIKMIDLLFYRFARYHIHLIFNDQFAQEVISFWGEVMASIDELFEVGFNRMRLLLLQLIVELFDLNGTETREGLYSLLSVQGRLDLMRRMIDTSRGECLGFAFGFIIACNNDQGYIQTLLMQHKQHLLQTMEDNSENTTSLKFVHELLTATNQQLLDEYHLEDVIEECASLLEREVKSLRLIESDLEVGTLKLRKIKLLSSIMQVVNVQNGLQLSRNVVYMSEEAIVQSLLRLVQMTLPPFKTYYLNQVMGCLLSTLTQLHRLNYKLYPNKADPLIPHLDALMAIDDPAARLKTCQIMRVSLLHGNKSMLHNQSLDTCIEYQDSLPEEAQAEIEACMRIGELLSRGQSLQAELDAYFPQTRNNQHQAPLLTVEYQAQWDEISEAEVESPLLPQRQSQTQPEFIKNMIKIGTANATAANNELENVVQLEPQNMIKLEPQPEKPVVKEPQPVQVHVEPQVVQVEEAPTEPVVQQPTKPEESVSPKVEQVEIRPQSYSQQSETAPVVIAKDEPVPQQPVPIQSQEEDQFVAQIPVQPQRQSQDYANFDIMPQEKQQQPQKVEEKVEPDHAQDHTQKWSPEQLLQRTKAFLKGDTSNQTLSDIIANLTTIDTLQFYHILIALFLTLEQLYFKDERQTIPFKSMEEIIIKHMPLRHIQLDNHFYQILEKSMAGASLSLRKKGIGLKGLQILCMRYSNSQSDEEIGRCGVMIAQNIQSIDELKYLHSCRIFEIVNGKLPAVAEKGRDVADWCRLISKTCQYPPFRECYEPVGGPLAIYLAQQQDKMQEQTKKCLLEALAGMTNNCPVNKGIASNSTLLSCLAHLMGQQPNRAALMTPTISILYNVAQNNPTILPLYNELSIEQAIIALLRNYLKANQYRPEVFTHLIGVLAEVTFTPQSAAVLVKERFMGMWPGVTRMLGKTDDWEVLSLQLKVTLRVLEANEGSLRKVVSDMEDDGLVGWLISIVGNVGKAKSYESYLSIFCCILTLPNLVTRCMTDQVALKVLAEVAKLSHSDEILLQKWITVLFQLTESHKYAHAKDILKSNIFYSAANSLKPFNELSHKSLQMNYKLIIQLIERQQFRPLLIVHGHAEFMVQTMKMGNIQWGQYLKMVEVLTQLQGEKLFPPTLCTKVFEIVLLKLEKNWEKDFVLSLGLLKKIKRNIECTREFGLILEGFFCNFMTQTNKVADQEYHELTVEVMGLTSYLLTFNEDIKGLFRSKQVLTILKNWLRISNALGHAQIPLTYFLCLSSIMNQHSLYMDVYNINAPKLREIEAQCEKGFKCRLYRIDGSCKDGIVRLDRLMKSMVAFKYPDGEIKRKYQLPLGSILTVCLYAGEKEQLYEESRFKKSMNPFQSDAVVGQCLTIIALCEKNEVREVSVELGSREEAQRLHDHLKIMISKQREQEQEEEMNMLPRRSTTGQYTI